MLIAITGTPGTGKTKIAEELSNMLDVKLIKINEFVTKQKLSVGYDKKRESKIVDVKKLKKKLLKFLNNTEYKTIIIEGHLAHFVPSDLTFVLRTEPNELKKRLKKRKYNKAKIRENIEAEILDVIYAEALENARNKSDVIQIDTTNKKPQQVAKKILGMLKIKKYHSDNVDWLAKCGDYLWKNSFPEH